MQCQNSHIMKKQDKKNFPDRKNYIKLLPAAAVIAAVAVTGVQGKAGISQKVQSESADVKDAEELTGLLATAYSYDEFSDGTSSSKAASSSSKKAKKGGIKKGIAKTLPDESQKTSATGQGSTSTPTTSVPAGGYKDGTYQGSGTGFGGTITVQVTISGGKITSIDILSASGETPSYFASAQGVIDRMISGQTPNVDAVSGATFSSNGIIKAVRNALSKAAVNKSSSDSSSTSTTKDTTKKDTTEKVSGTYKDGVYEGTGTGFRGKITVSVRIKKSKIVEIKLVKNEKDDAAYFERAWSEVPFSIIAVQSANTDKVDVVSGATYSSKGIMEAVRDALKKALAKKDTETTVETNNTNNSTNDNNTNNDNSSDTNTTVVPTTPTDQTYIGSAVCEPDEDGDFDAYDLTLEVVVSSDGKVKGIQNIKWSDKSMQSWYKDAEKKIVPQLIANGLDTSKNYDVVTGATCSSNALINAYKNAISKINQ